MWQPRLRQSGPICVLGTETETGLTSLTSLNNNSIQYRLCTCIDYCPWHWYYSYDSECTRYAPKFHYSDLGLGSWMIRFCSGNVDEREHNAIKKPSTETGCSSFTSSSFARRPGDGTTGLIRMTNHLIG